MKEKTLYICNNCIDYNTIYKSDMKKHLTKKNKCISHSQKYSFEEAYNNSLCKTYTFYFDNSNLEQKDYVFIISNYSNINNYIYEDFTNNNLIINNKNYISDIIIKEEIKEDDNKKKFICPNCGKEYTSKQNLIKHSENKSLCEYNQKYNAIINQFKEKNSDNILINNNIINNMVNNGNIINNIQNNNNNNSNSNTSNFNFKVNDFMNAKYDLTHISDDYYKQKDFFIFNNFLEQIMLNKNNHNIYFIDNNNNAVIYTENELNKVSSEKVGYIVLEKIEQAFSELYYKQDKDFINSYYRILKGQYRSDTIYKIYDIDEKQFKYTSNSRLNRSRDKNLGKIITTINKYHSETKNNLSKCNNNLEILTIEPNIENFISRRCRYKDLKS